jgi:hypothetical protein
MKIGIKLNQLTYAEYISILDRYQKYTDFNTLGLYRSILENDKLTLEQKIAIRELAHEKFLKTFEFLQLKDPRTYMKVSTLGETLTRADERQLWENVKTQQQKILTDKRIKHRNFGTYSKHDCGYEDCPYNGIMIHQGSRLSEGHIYFDSDEHDHWRFKSLKAERKTVQNRDLREQKLEILDEFAPKL